MIFIDSANNGFDPSKMIFFVTIDNKMLQLEKCIFFFLHKLVKHILKMDNVKMGGGVINYIKTWVKLKMWSLYFDTIWKK